VPADKPLIALLPGSRTQEINTMLPVMLKAAEAFADHNFVIAGAPSRAASFYEPFTRSEHVFWRWTKRTMCCNKRMLPW
jgi:lipid-A-disaccharide synthase